MRCLNSFRIPGDVTPDVCAMWPLALTKWNTSGGSIAQFR
jgi:hypothetical protein